MSIVLLLHTYIFCQLETSWLIAHTYSHDILEHSETFFLSGIGSRTELKKSRIFHTSEQTSASYFMMISTSRYFRANTLLICMIHNSSSCCHTYFFCQLETSWLIAHTYSHYILEHSETFFSGIGSRTELKKSRIFHTSEQTTASYFIMISTSRYFRANTLLICMIHNSSSCCSVGAVQHAQDLLLYGSTCSLGWTCTAVYVLHNIR